MKLHEKRSTSPFVKFRVFCGVILLALALSFLAGCMVDHPNETDMPWAAPAGWEGTMPLPGGYMDRYQ
jgi:hypothetical protein